MPDVSALPFYTQNNEHFLFDDIQISKGAPRNVKCTVDGEEFLNYRIAPCGGIKCCSVEECPYTISTAEHHSCPDHVDAEQSVQLSLCMYGQQIVKKSNDGFLEL